MNHTDEASNLPAIIERAHDRLALRLAAHGAPRSRRGVPLWAGKSSLGPISSGSHIGLYFWAGNRQAYAPLDKNGMDAQ
jgi:hypothetical protein